MVRRPAVILHPRLVPLAAVVVAARTAVAAVVAARTTVAVEVAGSTVEAVARLAAVAAITNLKVL